MHANVPQLRAHESLLEDPSPQVVDIATGVQRQFVSLRLENSGHADSYNPCSLYTFHGGFIS
jgi:hypothetical protein